MKVIEEIKELGKKRNNLLDIREASWDETILDYTNNPEKEIDQLAEEIFAKIKENRNLLPFEFIMEELTMLGQAPNLLYDDNGHFALSGSCFQSISEEIDDVEMFLLVPKNNWKNTIREALNVYLDEEDE